MSYRSGFISIIGRPNVGKSTLLNRAVGQKIAIMSDKPQTTRNNIQGVRTTEESQMVFIDTPGIHKPKHRLGDFMLKMAVNTLTGVDVILFVVNATEQPGKGDQMIIDRFQSVSTPVILVMNKIDLVHPEDLLPLIDAYNSLYAFNEIIPISAKEGNHFSALLSSIQEKLPEGPQYYPADQVTDHPERFIMQELIREQVLYLTREEVPHSVAVVMDQVKQRESGAVYAAATIIVERKSQKGILIGKEGAMLKKIGQLARTEMERLLGSKIYLELWVKVKEDWRNRPHHLHEYGFDEREYLD
ncbi:GTPase Era [Bacillaceae bacterium SIJ1]|uniref:GTPase Era n=1 Tax=Litoribacterium kuwaitense TaxID=1398745 RepID=UPI0013ECF6AD|nr:GTPase Era [Litoribacterium kuwaitense]NGP43525.1 GTPase Era [Litoribacterium kuwaitense]